MTDKLAEALLPCPFCGGAPEFWDGLGTQAHIECRDCGYAFVSVQCIDVLDYDERFKPEFEFSESTLKYPDALVKRINDRLTEQWNTRHHAAPDGGKLAEAIAFFDKPVVKENLYGRIGDQDGQMMDIMFEAARAYAALPVVDVDVDKHINSIERIAWDLKRNCVVGSSAIAPLRMDIEYWLIVATFKHLRETYPDGVRFK